MARWSSGILSLVAIGSLATVTSQSADCISSLCHLAPPYSSRQRQHALPGTSTSSVPLASECIVVVPVADHVIGIQFGDLFLGVAQQATEHLLVVLAHFGRSAHNGRGAA